MERQIRSLSAIGFVVLLLSIVSVANAQTIKTGVVLPNSGKEISLKTKTNVPVTTNQPATPADLATAASEQKATSENLLRLQEEEVTKASEKLEQLRQLVAEGLIARNELLQQEQELKALQARIAATRQQIADSDHLITEIKVAEEISKKQLAKSTAGSRNLASPTLLRYNGISNWSLANLSVVQQFFTSMFGRPLPTSAIGQSATHDRFGYDHRNAVDVALHPDSAEGKALIAFLQSRGIPFLAFRSAIPGVATGPHIHIGTPSHRLA